MSRINHWPDRKIHNIRFRATLILYNNILNLYLIANYASLFIYDRKSAIYTRIYLYRFFFQNQSLRLSDIEKLRSIGSFLLHIMWIRYIHNSNYYYWWCILIITIRTMNSIGEYGTNILEHITLINKRVSVWRLLFIN